MRIERRKNKHWEMENTRNIQWENIRKLEKEK